MKTLSKAALAKKKEAGATVKRKMGGKPTAEVQETAKKTTESIQNAPGVNHPGAVTPMPSELARSLNALVDQHAATSAIVSQNSEVIKSLFAEMAQMAAKIDNRPTSFDFKITRNRAGFMENITVTPAVKEKRNTH